MTDLRRAVSELLEKIGLLEQTPASSNCHSRLTVPFAWPLHVDPVDWLDAQPVYPKFYWQSRDGREENLALGQVCTYTDPAVAESTLADGQRIWGGRSFDGRTERNQRCLQSFFFLPQVELSRIDHSWFLSVNIDDSPQRIATTLGKLSDAVIPTAPPQCNILATTNAPEFDDWSSIIGQALTAIDNSELEKVVLARKTTLKLDRELSPAQLLKASRNQNGDSFHFMLALDSKHCFIGSTPERLFSRQSKELQTEALAGTIGRGITGQEDERLANWLLSDSKNIYENRLVVDDIVNRLDDCCVGLDVENRPKLIKLRKVQHLKRAISGRLRDNVLNANLLERLQPTAAIAGLPRDKAVNFIVDNEPFARGWYSGSVGFLSRDKSEFCVAIRSALVMGNELHLFAGAGIVPGSTADNEWKELNRKTSTLLSLLQSVPQNELLVKAAS